MAGLRCQRSSAGVHERVDGPWSQDIHTLVEPHGCAPRETPEHWARCVCQTAGPHSLKCAKTSSTAVESTMRPRGNRRE